jgi:hypothetical protein
MRSESLDTIGLAGLALRVEFVWRNDRYGHVISAVNSDGAAETLLESIEGTPADIWPPSPPLQSLHRETLPDGRSALLLVGAAGRSHWSASVETAPGEPKLIFDLACRHGKESGWLGCRYSAAGAAREQLAIESDAAAASWDEAGVMVKPAVITGPTTRWRYSVSLASPPSTRY